MFDDDRPSADLQNSYDATWGPPVQLLVLACHGVSRRRGSGAHPHSASPSASAVAALHGYYASAARGGRARPTLALTVLLPSPAQGLRRVWEGLAADPVTAPWVRVTCTSAANPLAVEGLVYGTAGAGAGAGGIVLVWVLHGEGALPPGQRRLPPGPAPNPHRPPGISPAEPRQDGRGNVRHAPQGRVDVLDGDHVEHLVLGALAAGAAVFLMHGGPEGGGNGTQALGRDHTRNRHRQRQRQRQRQREGEDGGDGRDGRDGWDVAYRLLLRLDAPITTAAADTATSGTGPTGKGRVVRSAAALVRLARLEMINAPRPGPPTLSHHLSPPPRCGLA